MKKLSASELEGKLRGKKNWGQKFKGSPWAMGPKVAPPLYTSIELILDVIDTHIITSTRKRSLIDLSIMYD